MKNKKVNSMELIEIFKQPIFKIKLDENLNEIQNFCLNIYEKEKNTNFLKFNTFKSNDLNINEFPFITLIKKIEIYSNKITKDVFCLKNKVSLSNIWFTVNKFKENTPPHTHPFSIISGVFYVKIPKNSGNIIFSNDVKVENFLHFKNIVKGNCYNTKYWWLPSEENVLYLFPSWLEHSVETNLSKKDRISISFNLN